LFSRAAAAATPQDLSGAPATRPTSAAQAEDATTYFALAMLLALLLGIAIGRRFSGRG
jgi:hypothetical protein